MKKQNLTQEEIEFLRQSNAIEGEYSEEACEDAEKAWIYAKKIILDHKQQITLDFILAVHRRLMKRLNPRIAGKFRKVEVGVMTEEGYKPAVPYKNIFAELRILQNQGLYPWYLGEEQIKQWHIQFQKIHPFEDGNGRVGRIIMNIQRLKIDLPLLIIHTGKEQQNYYKWFK
jgi:Fic family protein